MTLTTISTGPLIGIRKVLGASVGSIIGILAKEFTLLVIAGWMIAYPIAWWMLNKWLDHFAYRIVPRPWVLLQAGGISILIALFTICLQALSAARANPINTLRTE